MADLRDFTGKNQKFTGTIGEKISPGTTGERDTATYGAGTLRFNTTTNLLEYYTGVEWKSVDAPPAITNFNIDGAGATTSTFIDRTLSGNASIVVQGSLFSSGAVVSFRGNGGANFDATTTTLNSGNQVTAAVPYSSFLAAQEPYTIRVTNLSGLFTQLESCLSVDAKPVFNTASGTLGTIADGNRSAYSLSSAAATDPDGDTITYSITSGALPTGLSLNSSTAAITGTAAEVGSNTTSTFTVTASTASQTQSRSFSITVNAPVVTQFTSTGTTSFSVPAGVTAVDVLVVAGGGGGQWGGGGAGGMIYRPGFPVSPGGTVSLTVGAGGGQNTSGQNSVFGTLTAIGGGDGGDHGPSSPANGTSGGSGGGVGRDGGPGGIGGPGSQPGQPGDSGTYGHGSPGGPNPHGMSGWQGAGGGGGAGGTGGAGSEHRPNDEYGGDGGAGRSSTITGSTVFYAGGGGGGRHPTGGRNPGAGGSGGGGNGGGYPGSGGGTGTPGQTNRGGGGGGSHPGAHGSGGPGIVVVRY